VPHAQCLLEEVVEGSTVTVSFALLANYVVAPSGNIQLNFVTEEPDAVHYQKNRNWTGGKGPVFGAGDDGSAWTIDLGAIQPAGKPNSSGAYRRHSRVRGRGGPGPPRSFPDGTVGAPEFRLN
jgi:hypothetical protein